MDKLKGTRKLLTMRFDDMVKERQSWMAHWRDLAQFILPRLGRWLTSDRNVGGKRNGSIRNSSGTQALHDLVSFMNSGVTSPSRKWFRLVLDDPSVPMSGSIKQWLFDLEKLLYQVLARSNFYDAAHMFYEELALFGTAVMLVEQDYEDLVWCRTLTAGQYALSLDARGRFAALSREFEMTVDQIVRRFGEDGRHRVSGRVSRMYAEGRVEETVVVRQMVEFNDDRLGDDMPKGFKWRSVYWESDEAEGFLAVEGYYSQPVIAARWDATGENVYGFSPAMTVLPDVKGLQDITRQIANQVEKVGNPPLIGDAMLETEPVSALPGAVTFGARGGAGDAVLRPVYQINPALQYYMQLQSEHEYRIRQGLFSNLIFMTSQSPQQKTAREVDEVHEEKLLSLGPVAERQRTEFLDPFIDRVVDLLDIADVLPEPPEEIQGKRIQVDYISMLAQAQKALGTVALDRLVNFASATLAATGGQDTSGLERIDLGEAVEEYSKMLGVPPKVVRTLQDVKRREAERQRMQQQQQQMAMAQQGAAAAKDMGQTPMQSGPEGSTNALDALLQSMGATNAQ